MIYNVYITHGKKERLKKLPKVTQPVDSELGFESRQSGPKGCPVSHYTYALSLLPLLYAHI